MIQAESKEALQILNLIERLNEMLRSEKPVLVGPMQKSFTESFIKMLERELRRLSRPVKQ